MTTEYKPLPKVELYELYDGRLESHGITIVGDSNGCYLTDSQGNYLAFEKSGSNVKFFNSHDKVGHILSAISLAYGVKILTEDDPQFWGYESTEEMAAAMNRTDFQKEESDLPFGGS